MRFIFVVTIFLPEETIRAGTMRELSVRQTTLYAGKAFDHLEPLDEEAKGLLAALREGKAYPESGTREDRGPTRAELVGEAKSRGIKGAAQMKKEELEKIIAEKV